MATYTSQLGRDTLVYEGAAGTNLLEFRGDKTLADTREEIDSTTDGYLHTNDITQSVMGPRTIRLSGNLIYPAYGETNTAFSNIESAYEDKTLVNITIKRDDADAAPEEYEGYVVKFDKTPEMSGVEQVAVEIRLWVPAGT
jgi:hypothetical protein